MRISSDALLSSLNLQPTQHSPCLYCRCTFCCFTGQTLLGPVSPRLPRPPSEQQKSTPDIWAFLQGASPEAGVVLVGFGSTGLFGNSLHHTDYVELAAGFSALAPTRVLWPLISTNLPNGTRLEELPLGDNVLVVPWVDYNDVLGEPRGQGEMKQPASHSHNCMRVVQH